MSVEFYLATITEKSIAGDHVVTKNVLCFKQDKSGYDGKATKDHVKQYPGEYETFRVTHPDYVLPESFSDIEIGAPQIMREPDPVIATPKTPLLAETPVVPEVQIGSPLLERDADPVVAEPVAEPKSE